MSNVKACRYCQMEVTQASNLVMHERSCVRNPTAFAATKQALEAKPGLACGPREYMQRCKLYPGAVSVQSLRNQTGGNRWDKVAEAMGLRYEGPLHISGASQEWTDLDKQPRQRSGDWMESADWFNTGLRCRHKEVRTRTYIMPNGAGLRIVSDVYEVR